MFQDQTETNWPCCNYFRFLKSKEKAKKIIDIVSQCQLNQVKKNRSGITLGMSR